MTIEDKRDVQTTAAQQSNLVPRVSVIVPMYNAEATIVDSLHSVLGTRWPNLEVLVVDDGSQDHSREVVASFMAENAEAKIRSLVHPDNANLGPARSRNLAINVATGDYVCFLDADDLFFTDRISTAVAELEADPSLDAVFGFFRYFEDADSELLQGAASADFEFNRDGVAPDTDDMFLALLQGRAGLHTSTVTVKRSCLIDLAGFPNLKYVDDQALWLRLLSTANVRRIGNRPVAAYRLHANSWCFRGEQTIEYVFGPVLSRINALEWLRNRQIRPEHKRALEDSLIARLLYRYGSNDTLDHESRRTLRRLMWKTVRLIPRALLFRSVIGVLVKDIVSQLSSRTVRISNTNPFFHHR